MVRVLSAEYVKSTVDEKSLPEVRLPEVAFAGRSNVGKSSLINALVNQKRLALTSSTPGRTRALNFFRIRLSPDPRPPDFPGLPCYFVDLPGYGYARVPGQMQRQWRPMVETYIEGNPWLRGALILVDSRRTLEDEEIQMVEYLKSLGVPFQVVLTKCDKISGGKAGNLRRAIADELGLEPGKRPILFSAMKNKGLDILLQRIADFITLERPIVEFLKEME